MARSVMARRTSGGTAGSSDPGTPVPGNGAAVSMSTATPRRCATSAQACHSWTSGSGVSSPSANSRRSRAASTAQARWTARSAGSAVPFARPLSSGSAASPAVPPASGPAGRCGSGRPPPAGRWRLLPWSRQPPPAGPGRAASARPRSRPPGFRVEPGQDRDERRHVRLVQAVAGQHGEHGQGFQREVHAQLGQGPPGRHQDPDPARRAPGPVGFEHLGGRAGRGGRRADHQGRGGQRPSQSRGGWGHAAAGPSPPR